MDETSGAAGGPTPPADLRSSVPFDDTSRPFGARLVETVKLAFADPTRLFSHLPEEEIGPPVLFSVIVGTIGAVFGMLWSVMFSGMLTLVDEVPVEEFALGTGINIVLLCLSPAFVVVGVFIQAAIFHLLLMLLGGAKRGFGVTLRCVCYGAAPQLLAVVPICGAVAGGIWAMVLVIMAAIYGHGTDAWRVIVAYFLPLILCCCLLASLFLLFGTLFGLVST